MTAPHVTVLIPARDEAADIVRCLEHVLAQDHPHDRMEVVVVDGGSSDATAALAGATLAGGDVRWSVVPNPTGTTPSNLNAGLAVAAGEVLCRVDARSLVPPHYVRVCAEVLEERPEVVVVGGSQLAVTPQGGPVGEGIARALNNRYGMGLARYRRSARSGPADTVYLGAFRVDQVRAAGGWDEAMLTNQDFELNRRLGREGLVWFDDRLAVGYVPRRDLGALLRQYHRFGRWKVRYWRSTADRPVARQWVLLIGPVLGAVGVLTVGRRVGVLRTGAAVAAAALAVEHAGNRSAGAPAARAVGVAALGAVVVGWWTGVVRELAPSVTAVLRRAGRSRVGILSVSKAIDQGSLFLATVVVADTLGPARFADIALLLVLVSLAVQLSDYGIGFAALRQDRREPMAASALRRMRALNVAIAVVAVAGGAGTGSATVVAGGLLWGLTAEAYVAKVGRLRADDARRVLVAEAAGSAVVVVGAVVAAVVDEPAPFVVALVVKYVAEVLVAGFARGDRLVRLHAQARTWFGQGATYLANNVDYLVVAAVLPASDLSVYLLGFRASAALYAVTGQALTQDTFVALTKPDGGSSGAVLRRQLRRATLLGLVAAGIGVVVGTVLAAVLGDGWEDVAPITWVLSPTMPFRLAIGPLVAYILVRGAAGRVIGAELARAVAVAACVAGGAAVGVVPAAVGAAAGTVLGVLVLAAVARSTGASAAGAFVEGAEPVAVAPARHESPDDGVGRP